MKNPKLSEEQVFNIKNRLVDQDMLQEVWDIDSGHSIYKLTIRGKNVLDYCTYTLRVKELFGWEWKIPDESYLEGPEFCKKHNLIVVDEQGKNNLTPEGAEFTYCLTKLIEHKLVSEPKASGGSNGDKMQKFGKYMFKFMQSMNKISKVAQRYDTSMTNLSKKSSRNKGNSVLGDIPKNNSFGWEQKPKKTRKKWRRRK